MDDVCRMLLPLPIKTVPEVIIFVKLKADEYSETRHQSDSLRHEHLRELSCHSMAVIQCHTVPATCYRNYIASATLARIDRRQNSSPLLDDTSE